MVVYLLKWFFGGLVLLLFIGGINSYWLDHSAKQAHFMQGTLPEPAPSGFYDGHLVAPNPFWQGKIFYDEINLGVNVFNGGYGITNEGFGFKTYNGKSLKVVNHPVLKLDYNTKENPWWLRMVLDEVVQIDEDHYLGKMYVTFLWYPFTVVFFELSR